MFLCVLPFEFRPVESPGFDRLFSPDDFPLVIPSRR